MLGHIHGPNHLPPFYQQQHERQHERKQKIAGVEKKEKKLERIRKYYNKPSNPSQFKLTSSSS